MTDKYGININFSAVYDDGKDNDNEVVISFKDSDGMRASIHLKGEDMNQLLYDAFEGIAQKVSQEMFEDEGDNDTKPAKTAQELADEIRSLKIDNQVLKQRLEQVQNDNVERGKKCQCRVARKVSADPLAELMGMFFKM